jgi:hypothetical protein
VTGGRKQGHEEGRENSFHFFTGRLSGGYRQYHLQFEIALFPRELAVATDRRYIAKLEIV